jgi:GGDEF domain-containing protein
VGLLTLASSLPSVPPELYDAAFEKLKPLLSGSLRKGDVFTQWNRRQLIVLLMNAQKDSLERICRRIRKRFLEDCAQSGIELYFSFEPISEKVSGLE